MTITIPLFKPEISQNSIDLVSDQIKIGNINRGPSSQLVLNTLRSALGLTGNLHLLSSATAALHVALECLNVKGKIVLVAAQSFMATGLAPLYAGAVVKFVDVDPKSGNVCIKDLEEKVSYYKDEVAAIVVVHWGGNSINITEINNLSIEIPIIYDCAHALSTTFEDESVLNFGDICISSFQGIKEITCGDGGLLVVNNPKFDLAKKFIWFGMERDSSRKLYYHDVVGYKYNMNNIAASILLGELQFINSRKILRINIAKKYDVIVPEANKILHSAKCVSSYWLYSMLVEDVNDFITYLGNRGIESSQIDLSMANNPIFKINAASLKGAVQFNETHVSIPCRHNMSTEEIDLVSNSLKDYFSAK